MMIPLIVASFALVLPLKFGVGITTLELSVLTSILATIAVLDARDRQIPTGFLLLLLASGTSFAIVLGAFWQRAGGALIGFGVLGAILVAWTAVLRRLGYIEANAFAMGWADPFLLAGIGSFVGLWNLPHLVWLASMQGLAAWVLMPALRPALPIGSFLALATIELVIFSNWRPV